MKTITKQQAERIRQLVGSSDPHKEHGGLIEKSGNVRQVNHYGICRSQIILDENDFDWDTVDALWISHEHQPPKDYHDDCCDWCEHEEVEKRELPNDFLTPGEIDWSNKMRIPVVMYQSPKPVIVQAQAKNKKLLGLSKQKPIQVDAPTNGVGVFDWHDPFEKKTVQPHLYPLSERAGISLNDPEHLEHLDATARASLEYLIERERVLGAAWAEAVHVYNQNRELTLKAHGKLQAALGELSATERRVQQMLDRHSLLKTPLQARNVIGFRLNQNLLGEGKEQPVEIPQDLPPALKIPMQAFKYVEVLR